MVYLEDVGTTIDVPIDLVWEYLVSTGHGAAHRGSLRKFSAKVLSKNAIRFAAERRVEGRWSKFSGLSTDLRPLGIANVETGGTTSVSRMFFVYTPRGNRTLVEVFGDINSRTYPPGRLRSVFLGLLKSAYLEDLDRVEEFARTSPAAVAKARLRATVRIRDQGSVFRAPIDVLWKYLFDGSAHDGVHTQTRNGSFRGEGPTSFVYSSERNLFGRWSKESIRITIYRPLGFTYEWMRGKLQGSQAFVVYKPSGSRTTIDVHGEFVSKGTSPARLGSAIEGMLQTEFDEDAPAIRAFARNA